MKRYIAVMLIFSCVHAVFAEAQPVQEEQRPAREESAGGREESSPASETRMHYMRKDPFLAGVLSWPMWGVGHMYAGDYTTGSLLIFGDLVYKALLVGLSAKIINKYTVPGERESVSWHQLDSFDRSLVISYAVTYLGISLWAVFDAIETTEQFNRRFDIPGTLQLGMGGSAGEMDVQVGWNFPF